MLVSGERVGFGDNPLLPGQEFFGDAEKTSERKRALQEALSGGDIEVKVSRTAPDTLRVPKHAILEGLVLGPWLLPSKYFRNRIPAKGSTVRTVVSTTVPIFDHSVKSMRVVVKEGLGEDDALKEQRRLERILLETSIRAVKPLAVMLFGDQQSTAKRALLLTLLETGVVPVQRLRFESFHPDQRRNFFQELAGFLADMGNQGVAHQDLHLGNIGHDVTQCGRGGGSEFLLFDLESSEILDRDIFSRIRNIHHRPPVTTLAKYGDISENFDRDAYDVATELIHRYKVPAEEVERDFARVYATRRLPMLGQSSDEACINYIVKGQRAYERKQFEVTAYL